LSFDIDLLDATGRVCVQIKKYTARIYNGQRAPQSLKDVLLMRPLWQQVVLPAPKSTTLYERRIIIYGEENNLNADTLNYLPGVSTVALRSVASSIDMRITDYALQLLQVVQGLLQERATGNVLIQIVAPAEGEAKLTGALHALLNTAHAENPVINGQLIEIGNGYTTEQMLELLNENTHMYGTIRLQYNNGQRRQWQLTEYASVEKIPAHPWKKGGVYLVTGGAGGIGQLFAKEITQKASGAVVILTGRGAIRDKQAIIDSFSNEVGKVVYRPVDVADATGVNELVRYIKSEFGELTGIIHCAGVLHDGFMLNKTTNAFRAVLAPKVQGVVNLDKATQSLHPELFIICSSLSALIGNAGQCDYAVANAFMDDYARYRNASHPSTGTYMLSINWPLWAEGGMRVDEYIQEQMYEKIGMMPLQTEFAFEALYQAMAARVDQMAIVQGDTKRLKAALLQPFDTIAAAHPIEENEYEPTVTSDGNNIKEKAVAYFKKLLATTIKLPADRIDAAASMDKYGIDSIMVMQLTRELEKVFGSLPKTLFFEYRNINDLTNYFIRSYQAKLQAILGITQEPERAAVAAKAIKETKAPVWKDQIKNKIPYHQPKQQKADSDSKGLDIAIVGISGRYPQANNLQEFWENLCAGKNCITEIPTDRWDHSVYFDSAKNKPGKTYTKWGGFINGVDKFDSLFFNISPREAESLDPQERLFLQCAYEAVEDAGYTKDNLGKQPGATAGGQVGVYVGVMWEEYHLYAAQETALGKPMVLSSSPSSIANRVSFYFNFSGPSMAVDTMCSSSLTSIHLACQSLLQGECAVALAGGVNVSIHPNKYLVLGYGKYASSKGLCESFGAGGDGYVPGEGVGVVVLKPLAAAIADKDHIYGVIKGTAVNHGGKTNGFSVPDPGAQANVINKAITMAGVDVATISYLEAHGTGTSLGDPIEIAGLHKAFNTGKKQYCAIGSVKSNIGHCESAAGMAGLSKILLQIKHRQLVPSLHSTTLNPNIRFEDTPFVVQQELVDWKRPQLEQAGRIVEVPRRAGLSSFGA
ncbi:MAG TPA: type I polyketide synthase, partial [Niastella sp.]